MGKKLVEVIISAKDLTGAVVSKFQRRWRAMERTIRTVTRSLVAFTAAGAAAVLTLTKLGDRGDDVLAVKRAFARLTDDETEALKRLRAASAHTIEDYKLMSLANQAFALGAAKSVDQFEEMVRVSRVLGRAQGVDALSALESLTTGLARQSPRLLDNLGIQIKLGDATTFTARAMDQARELAAALGDEMESNTSWSDRFTASLRNQRDRLAELVAESPAIASFFDDTTDVLTGILDAIELQDWEALGDIFRTLGKMLGDRLAQGINLALAAAIPDIGSGLLGGLMAGIAGATGVPVSALIGMRERMEAGFRNSADTMSLNFDADLESLLEQVAGLRARVPSGGATPPKRLRPPAPDPLGVRRLDLSPFAGGRAAFQARRERLNRARSGPVGLMPGSIGPVSPLAQLTPEQQAAADAQNEADAIDVASQQVRDAQRVVAASMFGMAQAAVRGTDQVAESVVSMITQIAQSIPGVGGLLGTVIGGVGGLIGAAVGRRDRAVPVRLAEVDESAAKALADNSGEPIRITTIIEQGGMEIERIERDLIDRQNRDEIVRLSRGRPVGAI